MTTAYEDFAIEIYRGPDGYVAAVLDSPAGGKRAPFRMPFTADELSVIMAKLGGREANAHVRRVRGQNATAIAREFGTRLFDALLGGDLESTYRVSRQIARSRGKGLRIQLRLTDVPELSALPWEYLYDPVEGRFVALSAQTPVVRYLEVAQPPRPIKVSPPLRILVMISSPDGLPPIKADAERRNLEDALAAPIEQGRVQLDFLPDGTLEGLRAALYRREYHIFHFIGHGDFDAERKDGMLVLEKPDGRPHVIRGELLADYLYDEGSLQLVVLNSCEGARTSPDDPFSSVATTLVRRGVPAVVAMQFAISEPAAAAFAGHFYDEISRNVPVDAAMSRTRLVMKAMGGAEWGTPVLFMRSPDGKIFDVAEPGAEEQPRRRRPLGPWLQVGIALGLLLMVGLAIGVYPLLAPATPTLTPTPLPSPTPTSPPPTGVVGFWFKVSPEREGLMAINILESPTSPGIYQVEAYSHCIPVECDWGTIEVEREEPLEVVGELDDYTSTLSIRFNERSGELLVEEQIAYRDGSPGVSLKHRFRRLTLDDLSGEWVGAEGQALTRLELVPSGTMTIISAFGLCGLEECLWRRLPMPGLPSQPIRFSVNVSGHVVRLNAMRVGSTLYVRLTEEFSEQQPEHVTICYLERMTQY